MPAPRLVLDTNVLVSGLAYPGSIPGRILAAWRSGGIEVVLSHYILDEMIRVLPRLSKITLNADEIRDLADSLVFLCQMVEAEGPDDPELRDPADQAILGTLIASGAEYLVTGDKDLLVLANRYPIVTPADFWARHG